MPVEQRSTSGDPSGYAPYSKIGPLVRLNMVDGLGKTDQDRKKMGAGSVAVLIVFSEKESELPAMIIAAKDVSTAEKLSTGRFFLAWRTSRYEVKSCELYVPGQPLHREDIEGGVRLYAELETAKYDDEGVCGSFLPLADYHHLIGAGVLLGPPDACVWFNGEIAASARRKPMKFLRFDVRI